MAINENPGGGPSTAEVRSRCSREEHSKPSLNGRQNQVPASADILEQLIAEYSFKSWPGRLALDDPPGFRILPPWEAEDAEPLIDVTFFPSQSAQSMRVESMTLGELCDKIQKTNRAVKSNLPWLKLGKFGDKRSDGNSLRNNDNMLSISGVELDYDAEQLTLDEAVAIAEKAGLQALFYTSARYTDDKPRWRVLLPTSKPLPPGRRNHLVARVNGLFGGVFSPESFTLSQSYYFGSVEGNPQHRAVVTEGDFIDERGDLDAGAIGKGGEAAKANGGKNHFETYKPERAHEATPPWKVEAALAALPNDDKVDRAKWVDIGMLVKHAMPDENGFALFGGFSKRWTGGEYDERATRKAWDSFNPRGDITVGTLFFMADQASPGWLERAQSQRRAEQVAKNIKIGDDVTEPPLPQVMTLEGMHERLVFIGSTGAVADRVTGRVRKKEHAAAEYAASKHTFTVTEGESTKRKKTPALSFWIASKDRVTVECLTWVPGAPQICQPPEGPGPAFNTWRGLSPIAFPDDWQERVKPFLEHVAFLVPIEEERERFLQWLAHIVQCPEVLPHTCYLMTTPTTGIGRNWLASVLVRALRGSVAAGISLPDILDGGFTGRLSKKLLAVVDEAREGSGDRRFQRATRLTSLLNEEHRHINPKYGHQSVEKNCCRWLMFSNHTDAIPFDNSDRRVIVIANPTVRKEGAYYERLYGGLLNVNAFVGSVRHWLETANIASFRPGEHAPMNAAKVLVLDGMMTEVERAVVEFKEDCETELTSRSKIKDYIINNVNANLYVNDTHLTHAIRRAGMTQTGRRVRAANEWSNFGGPKEVRHAVVIVRGALTAKDVEEATNAQLLKAMGLKDAGG